ncbi:PepSY domain-containing protein [Novosphingobium sp. G106]|uniref:PepSY domain-containing protein n=1 Tax=Novosphingobium sp. G106 TaxID=2849500 RepID=UPI001C2D4BB1|nr:PepSY domain-containing protein [Novosphingobium sp. G106]MBV1692626.1 PepSY domain-containing protein [Novosphingobium sp. G106]
MKSLRTFLLGAALVSMAGAAVAGPHQPRLKGSELASRARINLASARMTALRARPGTITDQELEREAGGSGLRYSFDITSHGKPYEVGVDAATGAVLENIAEGKNPD